MPFHRFLKPMASGAAAAMVVIGLLASCKTSDYLGVTSPSRIPASGLEDPSNAGLLVNGAVADFECAYGSYVTATGLISDELDDATQTADRFPYDRRDMISSSVRYQSDGCTALGTYSPLQTARVSADNIRRLLNGWTDQQVPDRSLLLATAAVYEGYAELLLGEGFCSTAFSTFNADGTVNYGTEITPQQAFDSAVTRFSEAITAAQAAGTSANNFLYMAYNGRARAELDAGDLAAAKADAALVPAGFAMNMTGSTISSRRYNRVWADNGQNGTTYNQASSVGPDYRNLNDPRVPVVHPAGVPNSTTGVPIWVQLKYTSASSPIPIASYTEAQLIIAEADLASDPAAALTIINASRAAGGESALTSPTATELQAALINERARALFLQGTRVYDIFRFKLPLVPSEGAAYPGGGVYSNQICMPLPDVENFNNPALKS